MRRAACRDRRDPPRQVGELRVNRRAELGQGATRIDESQDDDFALQVGEPELPPFLRRHARNPARARPA